MGKRPEKIVSYNMSRIRSKGTKLEAALEDILKTIDCTYVIQPKLFGKPDFLFPNLKLAIFADSDFWHGYDWEHKKAEIKTNKEFWIRKIERNIQRDYCVNKTLSEDGWIVLRLWGHEILKEPDGCKEKIQRVIEQIKANSTTCQVAN